MGDYVRQNHTLLHFHSADSWVILSSVELSIKQKIEAIGVPLKNWDINIYRGILTGYNEAFIISTQKRNEIISNCITDEEKQKTESIIRPILRGRDIRRYGYNWAHLWIINTHNGVKGLFPRVNIEEYPALKNYLDTYWTVIARRADMGDTPYNLRNCTYLEDFSMPKIMYPNMTKYIPFYYDTKGFYQNDKSFMITGKHIAYLTAFFNSSLFKYCFLDDFPELQGGTRELRKVFFDKIPVKDVTDDENTIFASLVADIQNTYSIEKAKLIDQKIFEIYNLTSEEINTIGFVDIQ